jgi:hypothetical protein
VLEVRLHACIAGDLPLFMGLPAATTKSPSATRRVQRERLLFLNSTMHDPATGALHFVRKDTFVVLWLVSTNMRCPGAATCVPPEQMRLTRSTDSLLRWRQCTDTQIVKLWRLRFSTVVQARAMSLASGADRA